MHRAFRLPLVIDECTVAGWPVDDARSQRVKQAAIIIWDEAPMSPKAAFHAIDRFLRDLTQKADTPMGGKVVLLGGDFRQILPIVPHGHRVTIIDATLRRSPLWLQCDVRRLTANMRTVPEEQKFSDWLLCLGEDRL